MNVFEPCNHLIEDYSSYISSFIQIRDPKIHSYVDEQMESGLLWPESLFQLSPAFEPGDWVAELVDQGVLHPVCKSIELDTYYARLYGLTRDELRYILDTKEVHGEDFPSETFRVLKEKEIKQFGEYRTQRVDAEGGLGEG